MIINKSELPPYSVLMSVYAKEEPEFFAQSIESMLSQTYVTNDFVLICDGKLTEKLDEIVDFYEKKYDFFHPVRLDVNIGVAACANLGITKCVNEYIVKMDSDDIALPQRCERSLYLLSKHKAVDMLGTYIEEFDSETGRSIAVKKTPVTNRAIHQYAKRRNPFNNQTLIYKKSFALKIGGYADVVRCEDYDFVVRMLAAGAVGRNIDRVLVKYRVTENNYKRRRNWANTKSFIGVRWRIFRMGYSGFMDFLVPCLGQLFLFVMPTAFTGIIYKRFLRR